MNGMDFSKASDFWKAWQDAWRQGGTTTANPDPMAAWWQQQEQFWKGAMEQTSRMFGNQPELSRQWQDMQSAFLRQWADLARQAGERNPFATSADPSTLWKGFAEQSEKWFAETFRDKLPEPLRPHFETYLGMQRMFQSQWETMQGMIRNGMVDPRQVWQWVDPTRYAESVGRVMGFKPMGDLDEMVRQANRFFEQMREALMKMVPSMEAQMMGMGEAFRNWSGRQSNEMFPFLHGMQDLMRHSMEPYFQAAGQDTQAEVMRLSKDLHFAYVAYLNHTWHLQRMVLDAGAHVLPEMMQQARRKFAESGEMPEFDPFFKEYMDRLEAAIVEVMHTPEYTEVQNAVMKSGTGAKRLYDDIQEIVLKDWPFLTKREADDLAKETTQLRRKVHQLQHRLDELAGKTAISNDLNKKLEEEPRKPTTRKTAKTDTPA